MKKLNFNQNVLTAGIALALGITGATIAHASTNSGNVSPTTPVQISNVAKATYSVDGVAQPEVTSNAVVVNVSEVGSFTLVATQGTSATDDKNENQTLTAPNGKVTFTNKLTNTGNVADTYTITLSDTKANPVIITATDDFQFTDETTTDITVVVKKSSDNSTVRTTTIKTGGTVQLQPGEYAELSYALTADGNGRGGQSGLATISAKSTYITRVDNSKSTLINENQAVVKLPIFKISKTASVASIPNTVGSEIEYTITVKNDNTRPYAANATNFLIVDTLPTGLTIVPGSITVTNGGTNANSSQSTTTKLVVQSVDLAVGQTVTVKFKARISASLTGQTITNNVHVYDNFDSTPVTPTSPDGAGHKDSTDPNVRPPVDDSNDPTQPGGDTPPSTVTVTVPITRSLTVTPGTEKELPINSSPTAPATYTHTITNTGNGPESGLTFTITQTSTTDKIEIDTVTYTPNGGSPVTLTPNASGVYTIPGTLAPNGTGTITYTVKTVGATPDTNDKMTVKVIPAGPNAPTVADVFDTTHVKDMKLVKTQALDATCDGTPDTALAETPVNATPGQCIIYRVTATNKFTTKPLNNVVISDAVSNWSAKATYVANSAKDSRPGTANADATKVSTVGLTIPASGNAWLQFAIKINP